MSVLEELCKLAQLEVPSAPPAAEYWEELVRGGASVSDTVWSGLSKEAKAWLNSGVYALKGLEGYEIVPLELPEPEPEEVAEPEPETVTEIEPAPDPPPPPKRGRPKKAPGAATQRRAASFKRGKCYWFAAFLLEREDGLGGLDAKALAEEFNADRDPKAQVSVRTASVMLYDTLAVLRALRDLDQFEHKLVDDLPRPDADAVKEEAVR